MNSVGSGNFPLYAGSEENIFANKRRLRKDYQRALQRMSELYAQLEFIDYSLQLSETGPQQRKLVLCAEKEALLLEIRRFEIYIRTEEDRVRDFPYFFSLLMLLSEELLTGYSYFTKRNLTFILEIYISYTNVLKRFT